MFGDLKEYLVSATIIISQDWCETFEVMCDASGVAHGVLLGQRRDKILHPTFYACKSLNTAQTNYMVTEQALVSLVFSFEILLLFSWNEGNSEYRSFCLEVLDGEEGC